MSGGGGGEKESKKQTNKQNNKHKQTKNIDVGSWLAGWNDRA